MKRLPRLKKSGQSISFRPREDLDKRAIAVAGKARMTITDVIEECMEQWLPALEKRHGIVLSEAVSSKPVSGAARALAQSASDYQPKRRKSS